MVRRRLPVLLFLFPAAFAHDPVVERAFAVRHADYIHHARRDPLLSAVISSAGATPSETGTSGLPAGSTTSHDGVVPPLVSSLISSNDVQSLDSSTTSLVFISNTSTPTTLPSTSSEIPTSSFVSTSKTTTTTSATSSKTVAPVVVTVTSVITNADGSTSTATTLQETTTPSENHSSGNVKTWSIVGGVAGGIVVVLFLIFITWRFTQRRFSDIDGRSDEIKWPELQPDRTEPMSTLKPLGTRRTSGAGIEMGNEKDDDWDEDVSGSAYDLSVGAMGSAASVDQVVGYGGSPPQRYYDPYLGLSAAPQPMPPTLYPPSQSLAASQGSISAPSSHHSGGNNAHSVQGHSDHGHASPPRGTSPPLSPASVRASSPGPNQIG